MGIREQGSAGKNRAVPGSLVSCSKAAFTLIELLVVLAIIIVIATISVPTIESLASPKNALRKEGRKVINLMADARRTAMNRKTRVDVYIDLKQRQIGMVEAVAYRTTDAMEDQDEASQRFEKTVAFPEEFELECYRQGETDEQESIAMQRSLTTLLPDSDDEEDVKIVSFSPFGGSDGGGIRLAMDHVRLDIATDVLTGRPKVVDLGGRE